MTSAHDLHPSDFTSENNLINCSHMSSKLNILSNHTEYPKELVCLLYTLPPFYNFKISILNKLARPFGEDDFSLEKVGQSLKTIIKYLETIIEHLEAFCSDFYLGGQRPNW